MNKKAIIVILAVIIGTVGFITLTKPKEVAGAPSENKVGAGTSGVTLTEFGDFQCPGCGGMYPIVKQIKEHFGDKITFRFRHFPLESMHPNARAAARAAEAAAKQGKFWEMHDKLYENQNLWQGTSKPVSTFEGYASELGLDKNKFTEDFKSSEVTGTINADLKIGHDKNVTATPTFLLNDQKIDTPNSYEEFIKLIDKKIEELSNSQSDDDSSQDTKKEESNKPNEDNQEQKSSND